VISDKDFGVQAADDFALLSGATIIRDVHWFGFYIGNITLPTDNFTLLIYADSSGAPGSLLHELSLGAVSRTPSGFMIATTPIFAYSADITAITDLSAGTTYWLSVLNDTTNQLGEWAWSDNGTTGNAMFRTLPNGPWTATTFPIGLAFSLTDDVTDGRVPEPSTLLLLGGGMLGLAWRGLRNRPSAD
jgi:hypothetical protein